MLYLHKTSYFTCLLILGKRVCSPGVALAGTCRRADCSRYRVAGRRCPSAPVGGAGARAVAKGHEGRQDDHRTKGTEQRGDMEKRVNPGPEDPEKRCGFCFYKRKLSLHVYFVTSHRLIKTGKIASSFHDCLACSSHPTRWHGPLRRFPVNALTQLCLRKVRENKSAFFFFASQ